MGGLLRVVGEKWIFGVWDSLDYITCFLAHYRPWTSELSGYISTKVEIVSVSSLHVDSVGGF